MRIRTMSGDLRFEELKRVLEFYGYEMKQPRGGSSHCTFRKPGKYPITVPRHEPVKKVYVELIRDIIEQEECGNEDIR